MKQFGSIFAMVVALAFPVAHAQQADVTKNAVDAADRWLVLADTDDGALSWDAASSVFRAALSKTDWMNSLRKARQPLGAFKSRKLASSTFTHTLPGAADGDYAVIQYDTQFERKEHAVETVIPMREQDGSWKVSGYFVK